MFDLQQLERAHAIVGAAVPPTPAHAWPLLSGRLGAAVVVKHENHTPTGAFKLFKIKHRLVSSVLPHPEERALARVSKGDGILTVSSFETPLRGSSG